MAYGDLYRIRHNATVSTAITILQVQAGTAVPFEVLRFWINQRASTTSAQESIRLVRKTGAATVTAAVAGTHVFKLQGAGAPTTSLQLGTTNTGVIASGEGTDGDLVDELGFNVLSGVEWSRTHDGHVIVPGGGLIALKFGSAPASQSWFFGMDIKELG